VFCSEKAAHIVPRRLEEFRERTQPQLGKVHDPIKETMNVPPDHTFGVLFKPDEFGAGDLIHGRTPDKYLKGHEQQRAVLAKVRQQLKKLNYHNFNDLKSAFQFYDKVNEEISSKVFLTTKMIQQGSTFRQHLEVDA
jgi:hypothetical protein